MVKIEGNIHRETMKHDKKELEPILRHTTLLVLSMLKLHLFFFPFLLLCLENETAT